MNGCDGYEIAIEMRLHGNAAPDVSERLDRHVATCAGCRTFQAAAGAAQRRLETVSDTLARDADWNAIRSRVARSRQRYLLLPAVLALISAIGLASNLAWSVSLGPRPWTDPRMFVFELVILGGWALYRDIVVRRRFARFQRDSGGQPLFDWFKSDTSLQIRDLRSARAALFFVSVWSLVLFVRQDAGIALAVEAALCLGLVVYLHARALPSLRRELAELQA